MIVVNACAARVRLCRRLQATRLCVCVTATGIFCAFTRFPSVFSSFARFSTSSLSFLRIGTVFLLFHVFSVFRFFRFIRFLHFCTAALSSAHLHVFLLAPCVISAYARFYPSSMCFLPIYMFFQLIHMFSSHFRLFSVFESFCNIFCSLYVTQLVIVISGISFRSRLR